MYRFISRSLLLLFSALRVRDLRDVDFMLHQRLFDMGSSDASPLGRTYALDSEYWNVLANVWHLLASPIRPSPGDISHYRDLFRGLQKKDARVLILGATPELRDMVAEEGVRTVCVADLSFSQLHFMQHYMREKAGDRETWVRGDWLRLPFEQYFDVIFGDLTLQQFRPPAEEEFLSAVCRMLRPDGAYIGRFHFLDEEMRRVPFEEVIAKTLAVSVSEKEKFTMLKLRSLWVFADPRKRTLDRRRTAEAFRACADSFSASPHHALLQRVARHLRAIQESHRDWSPPDQNTLDALLRRNFRIAERRIASGYEDAKYYPIYQLFPQNGPSANIAF